MNQLEVNLALDALQALLKESIAMEGSSKINAYSALSGDLRYSISVVTQLKHREKTNPTIQPKDYEVNNG